MELYVSMYLDKTNATRKGDKDMTIKEIKENYKNYNLRANERNSFVTYDYNDGNGKVVIVVNIHKCSYIGRYVMQVIRVADGKELLPNGACRPCDNLDDAIDVAGEMEWND